MNSRVPLAIATLLISSLLTLHAEAFTESIGPIDLEIRERLIPELPGYTEYTFNLGRNDRGWLNAFSFNFAATELFQIQPYGIKTVFEETNAFINLIGRNPSHDSQILFSRETDPLWVVESHETNQGLAASFLTLGYGVGIYGAADVARLITPSDGAVDYRLRLAGQNPATPQEIVFKGRIGDPLLSVPPFDVTQPPKPIIYSRAGELGLALDSVQPTPGMPGFSTYTLRIDVADKGIKALEIELEGASLQQATVDNTSVVTSDANALLLANNIDPATDTQVLISNQQYTSLGVGASSESTTHLSYLAYFHHPQPYYYGGNFLQVVLEDGDLATLNLEVAVGTSETFTRVIGQIGGEAELVLIPEPAAILSLAGLALVTRRRPAA
ncbi:hypothetical protein [Mucisphaera sp.]|uniref:hypothetical protein n=1 Tax=Mucisphaera sp. TaxID=2913024 RepID=UPI003D10A393